MNADQTRRLFADGLLRTCGPWLTTQEWIASRQLDLPASWLLDSYEDDELTAPLDAYLAAVRDAEPVEFEEPVEVVGNGVWSYQLAVGSDECKINADVREFFDALTPDAEWRMAWTAMKAGDADAGGPIFARVHPEDGVLVAVAGFHPSIGETQG